MMEGTNEVLCGFKRMDGRGMIQAKSNKGANTQQNMKYENMGTKTENNTSFKDQRTPFYRPNAKPS